jgi:EmrB/QacA subfamily drug resistance transporter
VTGTATTEELSHAARQRVLFALMLTMALVAMDATIVATAIPSIVRDLGGFSLFPWVFSGYVLTQAVTTPIYGKLADLYGRKPVLVASALIFVAGSVLSGAAWSMWTLIAFRGLQGIGAGGIGPVVFTVVGDLYTVEERSKIQGWLSSVWGISAVVGPAIGGFFAEYASWRWIFYINVPLGAIALFVLVTSFHEPHVVRRRHELDLLGAALLVAGSGGLIFALLEGGVRWAWLSAPSIGIVAASVALLVAFAFQERRAPEPMLPPWVFGRRLLLTAALGSGTVGVLLIGVTSYLPTFAQGILGAGPVVAGFVLATMSVGWPVAASYSGRLYLRIGFRDTALIGSVVGIVSGILFSLLGGGSSLGLAAAASLVMGVGLGLISVPLLVGVQSVVDWQRRGVVTGASMFTRNIGQAIGAAVFGSVANSSLQRWFSHAPPAVAGRLPASVNAASSVLGGHRAGGAVGAFVRRGLELASHRVFLALLAVAVLQLLVVLLTPRRFDPLEPD